MEIAEIIAEDAIRQGVMPGAMLTGVSIAVDKRKAKLLHDDKTVFILEPIDGNQNEVEVHLFTADEPQGLARSAQRLAKKMKDMPGIQKAYSTFNDQKIERLLRAIGVKLQKSDKKGFTWMMEI